MIKFLHGNLLDAPTEAVVNTVNTVGVMGKDIALIFKEKFPHNFRVHEALEGPAGSARRRDLLSPLCSNQEVMMSIVPKALRDKKAGGRSSRG